MKDPNEGYKKWWQRAFEIELFDHETKFNSHHIAYVAGFCFAEKATENLIATAKCWLDNDGNKEDLERQLADAIKVL